MTRLCAWSRCTAQLLLGALATESYSFLLPAPKHVNFKERVEYAWHCQPYFHEPDLQNTKADGVSYQDGLLSFRDAGHLCSSSSHHAFILFRPLQDARRSCRGYLWFLSVVPAFNGLHPCYVIQAHAGSFASNGVVSSLTSSSFRRSIRSLMYDNIFRAASCGSILVMLMLRPSRFLKMNKLPPSDLTVLASLGLRTVETLY